jgi:hypothetical protein
MSERYKGIKANFIKSSIERNLVLLAHVGGFKPQEKFYYKRDMEKAYYPHHLGCLGICKVYEDLKPKLLIVSEFGEEFKNIRVNFVDEMKEAYREIDRNGNSVVPAIIPADIGLTINFGTPKPEKNAESREPCVILKEKGKQTQKIINKDNVNLKYINIEQIEAEEIEDDLEHSVVIKYKIRQNS